MNNAKIIFNSDNSNIGYSKTQHCQIMSTKILLLAGSIPSLKSILS